MKENLKQQIKQAPQDAGIYQFLAKDDKVLYVGKAKNLRNRLKSYLDENRHNSRISKMLSIAEKISLTTTNSEYDALLLECNLIKKLSPKYNILLRDDKSFANILVDTSHPFPSISKHRGVKKIKGQYFGPFASGGAIYETIDILKKSFLLRDCKDSEFKRRAKPCIQYQIKRCSAPCVGLINQENYGQLIKEAIDFLSGKKSTLQTDLAKKMQNYSNDLQFEKARILRDRIKALSTIQAKQNIHLKNDENVDFIALYKQANQACIVVSFFRNGNNYGFKPYFLNIGNDDEMAEILISFLEQFYNQQKLPNLLLLSHLIDDSELSQKKFGNCKIAVPKQGEKFKLIQNYLNLAKNELQKRINSQIKDKEMLVEIKKLFDLDKIPQRIEIYDNSHISGQLAVGAFVVAGMEGFVKNAYRKFNIRLDELDKKDDCAFLKQVLRRRFKKNNNNIFPDLIIIDGGKTQLNAANQVFEELAIDIKFVAMSKGKNRNAGEEWFHQIGKKSFTMDKYLPLMHYLQRLRDEAHRFAIGFNRQKRDKLTSKSALDEIDDIGKNRKKLLLNHFGSVEKIKNAALEDLLKVKGISRKVANKVIEYFG